jgi:hypothetical protein
MATVTNKRKVLNVEGKVEVIRKTQNGKMEANVSRALGPVIFTLQTMSKNIPKLLVCFNKRIVNNAILKA